MKILFHCWSSICEVDMIAAFRKNGHQVIEQRKKFKDPDYDQEGLTIISEALLADRYDAVFSVDFFPLISRVCEIMKVPYISWAVDCPVIQYHSATIKNQCNRIFIFDYAMYQEFYKENPEHIYYLPLGANVAHFDKVVSSITKEDESFRSDVSMVGSLYTEKCSYNSLKNIPPYVKGYAEGLMEAQLRVYGYNFLEQAMSDRFVTEFLEYTGWGQMYEDYSVNERALIAQKCLGLKISEQERIKGLALLSKHHKVDLYTASDTTNLPRVHNCGLAESRIEMPKIFHLSRINLNMTSKNIRTGLSQRVFDVMGCGGFLLTNYQEELPEYFEIGKEVEIYSSFEELVEKVDYYLAHDKEREQIARKGYEKVKSQYTYEERIRQMMGLLKGQV